MLRPLVLAALLASLSAPTQADPGAVAALERAPESKLVRDAGFAPDDIGFVAVDLDDGRAVAEHLADSLFIPASVAKLATVYPAQQLLGADFRFETKLYRAGDALYLQGGGDPVLDNIALRDLARQIKPDKNARWRSFFYDASSVAAEAEVDHGQPAEAVYNAGFGALNVDFNRVQINWSREDDGKIAFHPRAVADGLNVPADWIRLLPAEGAEPPGANFLYAGDGSGERWLYAPDLAETLPEDGALFLPVKAPAANTARVFRRIAADLSIALPEPRAGTVPTDAVLVGSIQSPPLPAVIAGLLKYSNNVTAELIGMAASRKLTGRVLDPTASSAALGGWLSNRLSYVDWSGFKLLNHSGLSSLNRASPRQIAAILTAIARDPVLTPLLSPIMGDDRGAMAEAKTGTMDFACGLAGFLTAKSGRRLAFTIFVIDRKRRAALDASFDSRVLAPTPGAQAWLGRAHALEEALLKNWRQRF